MNLEGWQAGLVAGSAFVVVLEATARAFMHWRRHRSHKHCERCNGCLGDDGRSLYEHAEDLSRIMEHIPESLEGGRWRWVPDAGGTESVPPTPQGPQVRLEIEGRPVATKPVSQ